MRSPEWYLAAPRTLAQRYGFALLACAVAGALTYVALLLFIRDPHAIAALLAAIILTSWYAGTGPAALAVAAGASGLVAAERTTFVRPSLRQGLGRALAVAADELGRNIRRAPLAEEGPAEVKRAAAAFNTMQARLQTYLREREQMLAAVSHDLRTPITRLRLRAEPIQDESPRVNFLRSDYSSISSAGSRSVRRSISSGSNVNSASSPTGASGDARLVRRSRPSGWYTSSAVTAPPAAR